MATKISKLFGGLALIAGLAVMPQRASALAYSALGGDNVADARNDMNNSLKTSSRTINASDLYKKLKSSGDIDKASKDGKFTRDVNFTSDEKCLYGAGVVRRDSKQGDKTELTRATDCIKLDNLYDVAASTNAAKKNAVPVQLASAKVNYDIFKSSETKNEMVTIQQNINKENCRSALKSSDNLLKKFESVKGATTTFSGSYNLVKSMNKTARECRDAQIEKILDESRFSLGSGLMFTSYNETPLQLMTGNVSYKWGKNIVEAFGGTGNGERKSNQTNINLPSGSNFSGYNTHKVNANVFGAAYLRALNDNFAVGAGLQMLSLDYNMMVTEGFNGRLNTYESPTKAKSESYVQAVVAARATSKTDSRWTNGWTGEVYGAFGKGEPTIGFNIGKYFGAPQKKKSNVSYVPQKEVPQKKPQRVKKK